MAASKRSILESVDEYVAIDIETTGYYIGFDEILEIGAVRIKNGNVIQQFNTLISDAGWVPPEITQLTGITENMLAEEGMPIYQALQELSDFCKDSILVGHNAGFDVGFLTRAASDRGLVFQNDYICTLRISRKLYRDAENHKLKTLAEHLDLSVKPTHRSIEDAIAATHLYEKIKNDIIASGITIKSLFKKRKQPTSRSAPVDLRTITAQTEFDPDNPFNELNIVFTGTLEHHTRAEGAQLIANLGAKIQNGVTRDTNMVIIGYYPPHQNIKISSKVKKAVALNEKGHDIQIINSDTFYEWLEDYS